MRVLSFLLLFLSLNIYLSTETELRQKISSIIPEDLSLISFNLSSADGFYFVELSDGSAFYMSLDGQYLFNGDIYKIGQKSLINLSDLRGSKFRMNKIKELNKNEFISFTPNEVKLEIYIFTDVDCGFCRKLHGELDSYMKNGIKINYLAFPREGLEGETYNKMKAAWCSENKQQILTNLKLGKSIDKINCKSTVVEDHYKLAKSFEARGTPTIILENGTILAGYYSADEITEIADN